jgi:hypothetical protein
MDVVYYNTQTDSVYNDAPDDDEEVVEDDDLEGDDEV